MSEAWLRVPSVRSTLRSALNFTMKCARWLTAKTSSLRVDEEGVRFVEGVFAPVVQEFAVLVEDHVRVVGARVDVHAVLGVAGDTGDLAPLPTFGQLAPALDEFVAAFAGLNGDHGGVLLPC